MRVEVIPTRRGTVYLEMGLVQQEPKVNPREWNDAVDEAIEFLIRHKLNEDKQFKKAGES